MRRAAGAGLALGVVLSVYVVVARSLTGKPLPPEEISTLNAVMIYLGGGLTGGALFGLLRDLTRTTVGAALVGFVTLLPSGIGLAMLEFHQRTVGGIVFMGSLMAVAMGPINFMIWFGIQRLGRNDESRTRRP